MYYWGLFKYDYRTHGPIQYVEEHDQNLANEARAVVTDGSAHLAMNFGATSSASYWRGHNQNVIYGPGSKVDNLMASKMACGEPVAVMERLGEKGADLTLTMASEADAVLLVAMAHCVEYASDVYGVELASMG